MQIAYLGSFFPESRHEEILLNSIGVIQNAGDTYQKAILEGLSHQISSYKIITSPMLGSYPLRYKKPYFKGSDFKFKGQNDSVCTAFCNLSLYKIISRYHFVKAPLENWVENTPGDKCIIVFSLDFSLLRATCEIKKKYPEIKICLIVTDLYRFMVLPKNPLSKSIIKYIEKKSQKYIEKIDSFVLLTQYMKDDLLLGERPFVVIEGIYNSINSEQSADIENNKKEQFKTILYTGTLATQYGIIHLLNAFSKIENEDYRLWICGEGDAKEEIIKKSINDNRIKYFGQVRREEALALQKRATILINPRLSDSEFTSYSFPSKTMEYLASGTPTIMHPLRCLPKEYLKHLFIAEDESDMGLMKTIIEVCEKPQEELDAFGKNAINFILNEKNSRIQVAKILEIINYEK